jgi:hypothetical protein
MNLPAQTLKESSSSDTWDPSAQAERKIILLRHEENPCAQILEGFLLFRQRQILRIRCIWNPPPQYWKRIILLKQKRILLVGHKEKSTAQKLKGILLLGYR